VVGKRKLLKSPLERLWMDVTYDISYVRGLITIVYNMMPFSASVN